MLCMISNPERTQERSTASKNTDMMLELGSSSQLHLMAVLVSYDISAGAKKPQSSKSHRNTLTSCNWKSLLPSRGKAPKGHASRRACSGGDATATAPDLASQGSIDKSSSCSTDNGRPTAVVDVLQQWIRGGHSHFQILCFLLLLLYTLTVVVAPIVYIALRLPSYSEVPFVIRLFCWAAFLGGGLAPWTLLLDLTKPFKRGKRTASI